MSKASGYDSPTLEIPASWEPLMKKVLRWYDNQIYPVWGPFFGHKTRSAKARNKEKSYIPTIATVWGGLAQVTKDAWATAAAFGTLNNYQLFTSDYSYRKKNGLSLPGTPNQFHQMMGLRLYNPSGLIDVRLRRDEKDLVGPITVSFTYKKTQNAPTGDAPFKFEATLYYFEDGLNKTETHSWSAAAGNVAWGSVSETFGIADRKYFHLTVIFHLDSYDAIIDLDRFLIVDADGDKYRENWQFHAGKTWEYDNLYRKTGWLFTPEYHVPYFEVVYLG